jgi:hypothetical protein
VVDGIDAIEGIEDIDWDIDLDEPGFEDAAIATATARLAATTTTTAAVTARVKRIDAPLFAFVKV